MTSSASSRPDPGEGTGPGRADANTGGSGRVSRRGALDLFLGTTGLAWLGVVLYPVIKYLRPLPSEGSADSVSLAPGEITKLDAQGYVIVRMGLDRIIVLRDRDQALRATDAKCTHEACTVRYRQDENLIWCACHNGRFDLTGRVVSGPPPRPLAMFKVREAKVGDEIAITVARA